MIELHAADAINSWVTDTSAAEVVAEHGGSAEASEGFGYSGPLLGYKAAKTKQREATHAGDETVRVYFADLQQLPTVDESQQRDAGRELEHARGLLRRAILSTDVSLRAARDFLWSLANGAGRLEHHISMRTDRPGDEAVNQTLLSLVADIDRTLMHNQQDFPRVTDRRLPQFERLETWRQIVERRRTLTERIEAVGLHLERLNVWKSSLEQTSARMLELRQQIREAKYDPSRSDLRRAWRRELRSLMLAAGETPATLGRRLLRIHAQQARYDDCRRAVSSANLRLVVSIAKRYRNLGLSFLDLIQEGNTGLMMAVDRWRYSSGNRFSTYASWKIQYAILKALSEKGRAIRLPAHVLPLVKRVRAAAGRIRQQTGRNARPEEIGQLLDLPTNDVVRYLQVMSPMFSLDEPLGDSAEHVVGDMVPDYRESEAEGAASGKLSDEMSKALDELKPRERQVIQLRFGLPDGRSKTLREIGQMLSVSPEGVRQIEARAVRKLRRPADRLSLQGFIRAR